MRDIYVYGDIGDSWGDDSITARQLAKELDEAAGDDVTIHVNSGGGNVFDANAMSELIRAYGGRTIAKIEGFAASAASYFALTADEVQMGSSALMMIHNPYACCYGEADDMRKRADVLDQVRSTIVSQYERKTGIDRTEIEAMMDAETYMGANVAKELGFVDSVIETEKVAARVSDEVLSHYKHVPDCLDRASGEPDRSIDPDDGGEPGAGEPDTGAVSNVICTNGVFLRVERK